MRVTVITSVIVNPNIERREEKKGQKYSRDMWAQGEGK